MKISLPNYALMGNPVSHSKSPFIHRYFSEKTNIAMDYDAILVPTQGFREALSAFQKQGGKGLNITLPFKQQAFILMDTLGKAAQQAGAVNTIFFRPDGSRYGENTDGIGFLRDYMENHQGEISGKKILLLGAGGAARGILGPILGLGPKEVIIVNRTKNKADVLVQDFKKFGPVKRVDMNELSEFQFDLIINATSASLKEELFELPAVIFKSHPWCYDMVYQSQPTSFLVFAKAQGANKCIDGLGMLVEQAAESFFIWHGIKPETQTLIEALRKT
ncbi:MAG: shikimate dehydrogenase [Gammaproteobacteria bacterium]|nr:shikimate dehydrogenase [Gammaproteobacteria bacterium]